MWFTVSRFSNTMSMGLTLMENVSSRKAMSAVRFMESSSWSRNSDVSAVDLVFFEVGFVADELEDGLGVGHGAVLLWVEAAAVAVTQDRVPALYENFMGFTKPVASTPALNTLASVKTRSAVWKACSRPHSSLRMCPRPPAQP